MLFDIVIGIHIGSLLNLFHSVSWPLRKTENYRVPEMWGVHLKAKVQFHAHLSISFNEPARIA
jgi:hypothetical protein